MMEDDGFIGEVVAIIDGKLIVRKMSEVTYAYLWNKKEGCGKYFRDIIAPIIKKSIEKQIGNFIPYEFVLDCYS